MFQESHLRADRARRGQTWQGRISEPAVLTRGRLVRQGRYSRRAARRSAPTVGANRADLSQVPCTTHRAAGLCERQL